MYYNQEILRKDSYYFSLVYDEVLHLVTSVRSLLAKNALVTLSEIFMLTNVSIENKYDLTVKTLIKKVTDKNEFIADEALNTFKAYFVIFN